jgi:hypothetical protein
LRGVVTVRLLATNAQAWSSRQREKQPTSRVDVSVPGESQYALKKTSSAQN